MGNIPTETAAQHPLVHTLKRRIVWGLFSLSGRHFSVMQNQKSRTQNAMIWNKQIISPFEQLFHYVPCRSSNFLQSCRTSFAQNWLMVIIRPPERLLAASWLPFSSQLTWCWVIRSLLLPPKRMATENTFWEYCLEEATYSHAVV